MLSIESNSSQISPLYWLLCCFFFFSVFFKQTIMLQVLRKASSWHFMFSVLSLDIPLSEFVKVVMVSIHQVDLLGFQIMETDSNSFKHNRNLLPSGSEKSRGSLQKADGMWISYCHSYVQWITPKGQALKIMSFYSHCHGSAGGLCLGSPAWGWLVWQAE